MLEQMIGCPECGTRIAADARLSAGAHITCPQCSRPFVYRPGGSVPLGADAPLPGSAGPKPPGRRATASAAPPRGAVPPPLPAVRPLEPAAVTAPPPPTAGRSGIPLAAVVGIVVATTAATAGVVWFLVSNRASGVADAEQRASHPAPRKTAGGAAAGTPTEATASSSDTLPKFETPAQPAAKPPLSAPVVAEPAQPGTAVTASDLSSPARSAAESPGIDEWEELAPLAQSDVFLRAQERGPVLLGEFAADERRLVTVERDGGIFLWDLQVLRKKRLQAPARVRFQDVAFTFSPDGQRLLTAVNDETVVLWDALEGRPVATHPVKDVPRKGLTFSGDGRWAAVCEERRIRLLDASSGEVRQTLDVPELSILAAAFSPDSRFLAAGGSAEDGGAIRFWDVETAGPAGAIPGFSGPVSDVGFSEEGAVLAAAHRERAVVMADDAWDIREPRQISLWDLDLAKGLGAARVRDQFQAHRLIQAGDGLPPQFHGWRQEPGQPAHILESRSFDGSINWSVAITASPFQSLISGPAGRLVALSYNTTPESGPQYQPQCVLYDIETGLIQRQIPGVCAVALSPDERLLLTTDGTVYDLSASSSSALELVRALLHPSGVGDVALADDGTSLGVALEPAATSLPAGGIRMWRLNGRDATQEYDLPAVPGTRAFRLSPDAGLLAAATYSSGAGLELSLWSTEPVARQHTLPMDAFLKEQYGRSDISQLSFSSEGPTLAVLWDGSRHWSIDIWNLEAAPVRVQVIELPDDLRDVACLALSLDGARAAVGSRRGRVALWDVATGEPIKTLAQHKHPVSAVAFSREGNRLAVAGERGELDVWDVPTGTLVRKLHGHDADLLVVTFSADSECVAAGGESSFGCVARVWNLETGEVAATISGHGGAVSSLRFSTDPPLLVTGDTAGEVRIWDARDLQVP